MCSKGIRKYAVGLAALGLLVMAFPAGLLADQHRVGESGQAFDVSAEIALSSLMSLGDGHLLKMADSLHVLATSEAVQSADWNRIQGPFIELARRNTSALNWFALPDGSYWSIQDGKEPGNLANRGYFRKVLAGETVMGELVVSRATDKPVAIVAVPVTGADDAIVGVLGASIYLDQLSDVIRQQMSVEEGLIFFSFDHDGMVALVWDAGLIFFEPRKSDDKALAQAFDDMLAQDEGVISYTFQDNERTVHFRRSPVTDWRYAFGIVR
jgi:hypothetical protein